MTSTRLVTTLFVLAGTAGLSLLALTGDLVPVIGGALLLTISVTVLVRHFWREAGLKREREHRAQAAALAQAVDEVRVQSEATRTSSARDLAEIQQRFDAFTTGMLEHIAQVAIDASKLREGQTKAGAEIAAIRKTEETADRRATKHRDGVLSQISGIIGVYSTLRPKVPYPPFGGWAIGGDCAQRLVSLILSEQPRHMLEAGSGLSTILTAQTLEQLGGEGRVMSLEHEEQWLEQTRDRLREHGVEHRVHLVHAPLVNVKLGENLFRWYDLDGVDLPGRIDLLFIDGPPKATGHLARYPALPLLYERLTDGAVVLLDDAGRPDEREAVERWQAEFPGIVVSRHTDAKGSVEIRKSR